MRRERRRAKGGGWRVGEKGKGKAKEKAKAKRNVGRFNSGKIFMHGDRFSGGNWERTGVAENLEERVGDHLLNSKGFL